MSGSVEIRTQYLVDMCRTLNHSAIVARGYEEVQEYGEVRGSTKGVRGGGGY